MGTAIKHPVPHWVKPSFVIFDIRPLWCAGVNLFYIANCIHLLLVSTLIVILFTA